VLQNKAENLVCQHHLIFGGLGEDPELKPSAFDSEEGVQ
jgi:hypothetical protein